MNEKEKQSPLLPPKTTTTRPSIQEILDVLHAVDRWPNTPVSEDHLQMRKAIVGNMINRLAEHGAADFVASISGTLEKEIDRNPDMPLNHAGLNHTMRAAEDMIESVIAKPVDPACRIESLEERMEALETLVMRSISPIGKVEWKECPAAMMRRKLTTPFLPRDAIPVSPEERNLLTAVVERLIGGKK